MKDLNKLVDHIKSCKCPILRKGLYSGGDWWAVYDTDYESEYGSRTSYFKPSRELTESEALILYIFYEHKPLGDIFMIKDLFEERKGFILDHYTPQELEEHAKKLKNTNRLQKRKKLEKELSIKEQEILNREKEMRALQEKLKELD